MKVSEQFKELGITELYHFTSSENKQSIIDCNMTLYSNKELINRNITTNHITDNTSRSIDKYKGNSDKVFLTFTESHPFIYKQKINKIDCKLIKINIDIVNIKNVLFSDRVSTDNLVQFWNAEDALKKLDIKNSGNKYISDKTIWNKTNKYEILIPNFIDLKKYLIH